MLVARRTLGVAVTPATLDDEGGNADENDA